jgi:hypothetical protein
MMAEDFSSAELTGKWALKGIMYVCLLMGAAAMAILAIYA